MIRVPSILRVMPLANWLALIALLALILVGFAYCGERDRAKEAEGQRELAEGRTESAVEAIEEIQALGERGEATDKQVQEAQDAIREAAPDDRDRVWRYELCRLHDRPDCDRLFGPR